ncbi:MAG: GIY-YIG nuclease family protein [Candidatus Omnitrophica bacterium]|jgi:putative endonuclease|nr:GIY-YIG nuclease family protein [Candidatus Omnitrophota bacterium]
MAQSKKVQSWYVYILKCKNSSLYTGITNNLQRRLNVHRQGKGAKYTNSFGVLGIVYRKKYPTKQEALMQEARIKKLTRKDKLALIK